MLITFEGLDGSGKTTQIQRLISWLRTQGQNVVAVREPGGTRIGDMVREILHDRAHTAMDARTELLLYCASRAQLIAEQIEPHLREGHVVLCDRYADSTLAYQGYGRGLDMDFLRALLRFATHGIAPDLTIYFDVDPEHGLERRRASGTALNRIDAETLDFHRRVRAGYHQLISENPGRWVVVDASQSQDAIAAQVREAVEKRSNITA
jgi:dTMP kinase